MPEPQYYIFMRWYFLMRVKATEMRTVLCYSELVSGEVKLVYYKMRASQVDRWLGRPIDGC